MYLSATMSPTLSVRRSPTPVEKAPSKRHPIGRATYLTISECLFFIRRQRYIFVHKRHLPLFRKKAVAPFFLREQRTTQDRDMKTETASPAKRKKERDGKILKRRAPRNKKPPGLKPGGAVRYISVRSTVCRTLINCRRNRGGIGLPDAPASHRWEPTDRRRNAAQPVPPPT